MDEYFTQKCVTSDAPQTSTSSSVSVWSPSARCEFVVVQENQQAHGASRAVLASIVHMVTLPSNQLIETSAALRGLYASRLTLWLSL